MADKAVLFAEKMTDEARLLAYRMYGEGFPLVSIVNEIKDQFGIEITHQNISLVVRTVKGKQMVKKFRDDYMAAVKDVPIANKRIRIDDLEKVRNKILRELDDLKVSRDTRFYFLALIKRLNETIATARDEMENKLGMAQQIILGNFSDRTDDELMAERDEILRNFRRLNAPRGDAQGNRNITGVTGSDTSEPA